MGEAAQPRFRCGRQPKVQASRVILLQQDAKVAHEVGGNPHVRRGLLRGDRVVYKHNVADGSRPVQFLDGDLGQAVTVPDAVGLVGVALYVGAYAGLQTGKLGLADVRYTILNAVGGLAVIFSLIWSFNLAAFVTQVLWLVFTLVGYLRSRRA